jgi:hypothetical protein
MITRGADHGLSLGSAGVSAFSVAAVLDSGIDSFPTMTQDTF